LTCRRRLRQRLSARSQWAPTAGTDLVHSLVQVAREAGAEQKRVTVGGVSLELRENGIEEILSIRTAAAS
jgi:methylmalonyl-CoA mutase cobalamin-binding subunit